MKREGPIRPGNTSVGESGPFVGDSTYKGDFGPKEAPYEVSDHGPCGLGPAEGGWRCQKQLGGSGKRVRDGLRDQEGRVGAPTGKAPWMPGLGPVEGGAFRAS